MNRIPPPLKIISHGLYCLYKHWAVIVLAFASNPATKRSNSDRAVLKHIAGRKRHKSEEHSCILICLQDNASGEEAEHYRIPG